MSSRYYDNVETYLDDSAERRDDITLSNQYEMYEKRKKSDQVTHL